MKLAEITVKGVHIKKKVLHAITSGMVGATVSLSFSGEWANLSKTVVFKAGNVTRDVLAVTDWTAVPVPPEVLEKPGLYLRVGVYGTDLDGTLVIPTVWADVDQIRTGVDPSGDPSTDPTPPVWAQLQAEIEKLKEQGTGGAALPAITEADEGKYLRVENGAAVWGDLKIPEQYGLVTYDQDKTITIS